MVPGAVVKRCRRRRRRHMPSSLLCTQVGRLPLPNYHCFAVTALPPPPPPPPAGSAQSAQAAAQAAAAALGAEAQGPAPSSSVAVSSSASSSASSASSTSAAAAVAVAVAAAAAAPPAATWLASSFWVVGGTSRGRWVGSVFRYDTRGRRWHALPPMPTPRRRTAAAVAVSI
jgi:hypothetical protein